MSKETITFDKIEYQAIKRRLDIMDKIVNLMEDAQGESYAGAGYFACPYSVFEEIPNE
tara:strand:+ start:331 stop:504 length:174 start_codon:yes stop_codon:yes gene_type:complete